MASKYWIKLYHEILYNYKMCSLSDRHFRRVIELFLLAGEFHQEGKLPEIEVVAWKLRIPVDELMEDLLILIDKGIITKQKNAYIVTNFAERQAPMSDTERQRLHRNSLRKVQFYGHTPVTNCDSDVSQNNHNSLVDIDKDIDKDTDIDIDKDSDLDIDTKKILFSL